MHKTVNKNKVIVLGVDAFDYTIADDLMKKGKLPNLLSLKEKGSFSALATTIPSESVVAWSSFATGLQPGNHGVFDFVMRNPAQYSLYLALNEITYVDGKPITRLYRKGRTIWNILSDTKVPGSMYFCPNTFPPDPVTGKMLSGMGTPDIQGNMGRFSFYTTKPQSADDADSRGRIIHVNLDRGIIDTEIYGPKKTKDSVIGALKVPLKITVLPKEGKAICYFQGQKITLINNEWSGWQKIVFKAGFLTKLRGIFKFYLKSIAPDFELYVSPINFDPRQPFLPVSYPRNYSKRIAEKTGLYHTQGMPHDTWALSEGRIDEMAFLEHVEDILNERKNILKRELNNFKEGLFFFYFDTLDIIQHMFWRYIDPEHPLYEAQSQYRNIIEDYYKKIDDVVGEVLKGIDAKTMLLVVSDHGFSAFRESVHLNRWLLENGYLFLKPGETESKGFLENIDWAKTKAYALGFGGIYLNRKSRESQGTVDAGQVRDLKRQIQDGLLNIKNAKGQTAVNNVYDQEDVFKGRFALDAPDLFVGFAKGFRASWQTALGGTPRVLFEDNRKKWSGDHLIDAKLVPGVIFSNRKIEFKNPSIIDIAPTLLDLFGIAKPADMEGKSLFRSGDSQRSILS
ncbi:MAG: alkaline phosphatase family protein [Candidatus Omnitrophota bacterium]